MKAVIVFGPQGCGKSVNAEKLKAHFGMQRVIDDWFPHMPLAKGDLALTHFMVSMPDDIAVVSFQSLRAQGIVPDDRPGHAPGFE